MNIRKSSSLFSTSMGVMILLFLMINLFFTITKSSITIEEGVPKFNAGFSLKCKNEIHETPELLKDLFLKLKSYGFTDAAYQAADQNLPLLKDTPYFASVYYELGKEFFEAKEYEKAFVCLVKAEMFNPDADLKRKIQAKQVNCLEKLGKSMDANNLLNQSVQKTVEKTDESPVLAVVGNSLITQRRFFDEIQRLPISVQEKIKKNASGEKTNFLRQMVLTELLYHKALRLGMDEDKEIDSKLERIKYHLLADTMLETEMSDIPKPGLMDLQNYYEIHKEEFKPEDADTPLSFDEVKKTVEERYLFEKRNEEMQKVFETYLKVESVQIFEENLNK